MTFARVTVCQEEDEPGPLYATREGVSTETFGAWSRSARKITALTRFAAGGYDARTMRAEPEGMTVSNPEPSAASEAAVRCGRCPHLYSHDVLDRQSATSVLLAHLPSDRPRIWLDEGHVVPGEAPDDVR